MKKHILTSLFSLFLFFGFAQLKSPSEFLNHKLGTQFSRHHEVVDYFKHVSLEKPKQVKLIQYGITYERRPLYIAYVSSENNLKNLETIKENNLKQAGVVKGNSIENKVAIVWLSYNVHGNEASSTEASMKTIYDLLTKKQELLENTIVIIDLCLNPDGRDRYVNWFNRTSNKPYNIDQQAVEHKDPWPTGRPNHYLFDLNRDWVWATQIETTSRLKLYNQWLPHIHVDFHEQGINEPYYFAPAAEPFHEVISNWQREFQTQIGKNNAKYFDENGWLYFTRERFDLFYPSYGDTYPTFSGAIGMTYEQAGHGRAGLGILNDEGIVLTLKDRIAHHATSGLSTVEMASKNAERLNTEFKAFFNNKNLKYKSYVLKGNKDKIETLKRLLDKHNILYGHPKSAKVSGFSYEQNNAGTLSVTANDLVVSTNQPKGKMVKVLFEPKAKLKDSLTYDITAWSIPYAYGLEAISSTTYIDAELNSDSKSFTKNNKQVNAVAYVSKWNHLNDSKFLAELLKQNFKVRFTEKPIQTKSETFNRGSLILTSGDNSYIKDFDDKLVALANKHKRKLNTLNSGFSNKGPDLGSPDIKLIHKPKIALLTGKGTSSLNYGALWHFFEQQLNYPISSINTESFSKIDLNKYNILILPNGNYSTILNEKGLKKLEVWIKKGGKVIAISNALKSFAGKKGFNLKKTKTKETIKKEADTTNLIPYANRERERIKKLITGAIFKTKVDKTHPLAFGYSDFYFTLKQGNSNYKLLGKENYNICYLDKNPNVVSGFAGNTAKEDLNNTLIFGEERFGKGSLIYMVDDVSFRGFWENGKLFLANAIFFVNNNAFKL